MPFEWPFWPTVSGRGALNFAPIPPCPRLAGRGGFRFAPDDTTTPPSPFSNATHTSSSATAPCSDAPPTEATLAVAGLRRPRAHSEGFGSGQPHNPQPRRGGRVRVGEQLNRALLFQSRARATRGHTTLSLRPPVHPFLPPSSSSGCRPRRQTPLLAVARRCPRASSDPYRRGAADRHPRAPPPARSPRGLPRRACASQPPSTDTSSS